MHRSPPPLCRLPQKIIPRIERRFVQVDCYPASYIVSRHWRPKLARRGCKNVVVYLYDITTVDKDGARMKMVLSPFYDRHGILLQGRTVYAKKIIKLKVLYYKLGTSSR